MSAPDPRARRTATRSAAPPRRVDPLVVIAVAALLPALGLWGIHRWADGRAAAGDDAAPAESTPPGASAIPPTPALATGLLSYRRAAAQLSLDANLAAFEAGVQPLLGAINDRSCAAISINGRLVGERNAASAVIPASNLKILVGAVAAEVLGADFRYTTTVVGAAPSGGVVTGDVYLVGGGDPLLSSEWYPESNLDVFPVFNITPLDELARQLGAAGVTQIQGRVLGDGSRYDDEWFLESWGPDVAGIEAGPYDALLVNDSRVLGDDQRGSDPNESAAREFVRILGEHGITVAGGAGSGTSPGGLTQLASLQSPPIAAAIAEMLTNSDNNTAELMVKEIGLVASGSGTRQAGLDAITATIQSWGIDIAGLVVADGSGLSTESRITCTTMLEVLQHAGFAGPVGQGLAIGGQTGTLVDAFADTSLAGRIRGKTGTLNNVPFDQDPPAVKALSGYLPVDGDGAIEYVLILNGGIITDQREYRPIWAELVTALTSYPTVVNPRVIGPR